LEVTFENVTKIFGEVIAVDNLSLKVEDRDFLILLGPSGCGKTTTLRLVAGLETPDSGNIFIGDTLVNDLAPKDRDVAMVFQSYALYPYMSVYDNIAFPLKLRKMPKGEIRKRVLKTAELLEIDDLLERKPRQLSGGQQQRVALGRAIVREPQVFLMDEPLSNLDAKLRVMMRTELRKLHQKLKITTIYVTHDQEEAMTLGKRIAVMNQGVLQQFGTPEEVYTHPANLFVAGFVGSPAMNMLEGDIIEKNGKLIIDVGVFTYPFPSDLAREILTPKIVLGIRPEDVIITNEKDPNAIPAKIEVIEPLGRECFLSLAVSGFSLGIITRSAEGLTIGDDIWIKLDEKRLHIFDGKSQKRLGM